MNCALYLVSKPTWQPSDRTRLEEALATKHIASFQLRLPNHTPEEIEAIARDLVPLCHSHGVMFLLNDSLEIALRVNADGLHIGGSDGDVREIRNALGKEKILGVSCYDSKERALSAGEYGADYVSFGTFFPSPTKNSGAHPTPELLEWWSTHTVIPCVAIGGITAENSGPLIKAGADFIAIVSAAWDHPAGIKTGIETLHNTILTHTRAPSL